MAAQPPVCAFDWPAAGFRLPDPQGRLWSLDDIRGPRGTLVMFLCNHCPYVIAVAARLVEDVRHLQRHGIGAIAIMANDFAAYPEDAPPQMQAFATRYGFSFPYVVDESQDAARAYQAVCTPDFFGFNADLRLQYRGRLDGARTPDAPDDMRRDLREAMLEIAATGRGPAVQTPSIGCSIKWKPDV